MHSGRVHVPSWLAPLVDSMIIVGGPFYSAVAAGLLGMYSKPDKPNFEEEMARYISGDGGPLRAAQAWFLGLSEESKEAVRLEARVAVETDIIGISSLKRHIADAAGSRSTKYMEEVREFVRCALHRRTYFEVVSAIVCCEDLSCTIEGLDRQYEYMGSMWSFIRRFDDDPLLAASAIDPDCWWGQLVW